MSIQYSDRQSPLSLVNTSDVGSIYFEEGRYPVYGVYGGVPTKMGFTVDSTSSIASYAILDRPYKLANPQTSDGWTNIFIIEFKGSLPISKDQTASRETRLAILELKRISGLTWDQLAQLFGVARRTLHFWANGKPLNAMNEERLSRFRATIRMIDRGSAMKNRSTLLGVLGNNTIPYDMLRQGKYKEVADLLGYGPGRKMVSLTPLSTEARAARMPQKPHELVGALHDKVHRDSGRSRAANAVRINKRGQDR